MRRRDFIAGLGLAATGWPLNAGSQPSQVGFILWFSTEAQPDPFIAEFRKAMRERGSSGGTQPRVCAALRARRSCCAPCDAPFDPRHHCRSDCLQRSGHSGHEGSDGRTGVICDQRRPGCARHCTKLFPSGGNFTGTTLLSLDVAQKRVQLVRELLPQVRTLVILSQKITPENPRNTQLRSGCRSSWDSA